MLTFTSMKIILFFGYCIRCEGKSDKDLHRSDDIALVITFEFLLLIAISPYTAESVKDSQTKFQMFLQVSGHHVGVLQQYTNMAPPY